MINLQPRLALPSTIQFDSISIGNAITASTITVTSAVTASLLVVQNLASINSLVVSSNASVNRLVCSSNIVAGIASFDHIDLTSSINAARGNFVSAVNVTGVNGLHILIDTPATANNAWILFADGGVSQWEVNKNTLNRFVWYSYQYGSNVMSLVASTGEVIFDNFVSAGRFVAVSNIQAVIGSFNRLEVASNIQAQGATFASTVRIFCPTVSPASTAISSKQFVVNASAGSVLTFTWTNSVGNMYRATLSGASA